MKIIMHHGCKSSGMVVYINTINSVLCLKLVEQNLIRGGCKVRFTGAWPYRQPAREAPVLRGGNQQRIQFFII
jgi:hypothetical protein